MYKIHWGCNTTSKHMCIGYSHFRSQWISLSKQNKQCLSLVAVVKSLLWSVIFLVLHWVTTLPLLLSLSLTNPYCFWVWIILHSVYFLNTWIRVSSVNSEHMLFLVPVHCMIELLVNMGCKQVLSHHEALLWFDDANGLFEHIAVWRLVK